jgi:polyhydroxybutyrate depolymerase
MAGATQFFRAFNYHRLFQIDQPMMHVAATVRSPLKFLVHGLCVVALAAGGAFAAPAPAKDGSARERPRPSQQKKKKQPQRKPTAQPRQQPPRNQQPPRPQQNVGPATSTDTRSRIMRPGDHLFSIQHGGLTRMYSVHVPPGYDPARPAPLLVALHGGGSSMDLQANAAYGLIGRADSEGFIVVFPKGSSNPEGGTAATWNAGKCCGAAGDRNVDDVGFIRQVVTNVFFQMSIDRSRIFATGISSGGMMAYRLACEMPEVFRAIASVAGTDNTSGECTPGKAVSVLHIHAKDDPQVPFAGGPIANARPRGASFTSVQDTVTKWARLDGCAAQPRPILHQGGAYCEAYSWCRGAAEVQLCVTETGGHSWPGGKKPRESKVSPSQAISATDLLWGLFNRP